MKIFISYRREDSREATNRIAKRLKNQFGDDSVILDTDNFLLGKDFREEIMQNLRSADVVLVVIGEFWHSIIQSRSETSEVDWVLKEVETAIQENKIVIPLLLDGIGIPPSIILPPTIQELPNKNGLPIHTSTYHFDAGIRRLNQKIQQATGVFTVPQRGTKEYLLYLLLNSSWNIQASHDANEVYLCEKDTGYKIVVDILSDEREDDYTSEWADHFIGPHRTYPVYIKHDGEIIDKTYFVSIWGAKYFVPIASVDGTIDHPVYFWDVHSIELQLARHIARFHTLYKTIEEFASHAEIEFRE